MLYTIQAFIITLTFTAFTFADVFMTELTDPQNSTDAGRYVELYNNGDSDVDLSTGWKIQRWTNANPDPTSSSIKDLTGTISAGGFYIICNDADKFNTTYGLTCDQDIGTGGAADSNGDDNMAILDASGVIVDMFGVAGEDGTGTGHEFEDGRAERADGVCGGAETWDVAEWNIDNDSGGGDGNQYAPEGFDPGSWTGSGFDCGGGSTTCDDEAACNTGADGACEYPDTGYDCDGNCVGEVDCAGVCGGGSVEDCAGECGGGAAEDACGLCGGDGSSCSVSVTFTVDMSIEGVTGDIKLRTSTINGEYNPSDWYIMTDDGNGTYSHTLSILTGVEYGYNFNNSDGSGYESGDGLGDCAGGNYGNDRFVTPGNSDITLDTVCWESCEACPEDILGCTDETALNYDASATLDDGSCVYDWPEAANLFFSEYAEGSSYNKYLEIFNGSDGEVDLSGYSLSSCSNGCDDGVNWDYPDNVTFEAGTTVAAGDVFVVCHGSSDEFILAECDQTFSYLSNGDDVFALTQIGSGVILDIIGTIGDDPGSGWEVAGVIDGTKDHTLVRNASVDSGNGGNWEESAGDADGSEWEVYDQNTWDFLGFHNMGGDECSLGDVNNDATTDVLDIVSIVGCIIDPNNCPEDIACADTNGDGAVNVLDVVAIVNVILNPRTDINDATSARLIKSGNALSLLADGYVGGVQLTLSHGLDFSLQMNKSAWIAEYATHGTKTNVIVIDPELGELFTASSEFEITDMIVANSKGAINSVVIGEFSLSNAYPNPFNPSTTVELTLPEAGHVSVMVYNITGQLVAELADSYMAANQYQFTWQGENVPSGMYLLRAEYAGQVSTQKLMLLK
ncbi:T9SS C-terminal target domain-containing protein [Candidatus Marinimicrobia bacterium PRS2]|nr:T9SS C-terminal target domain-containing protein [Candidatus Marinimicrobia bacterium PRS2]